MPIYASFKLYKPRTTIDNYLANGRVNVRKTQNLRAGRSGQEIKGKNYKIEGGLFSKSGNKPKAVIEIHKVNEKVITQLKAEKLKTSKTGYKNVSKP